MSQNTEREVIFRVQGLQQWFPIKKGMMKKTVGHVKAVDDITLDIYKGETLGIVGESGCGKSQTAMSIMRLNKARIEGEINFKGQNMLTLPMKDMRKIRGNDISMIFQDPMTALNPVFTVGDQIAESIFLHENCTYAEAQQRAVEMLIAQIEGCQQAIHEKVPFELWERESVTTPKI